MKRVVFGALSVVGGFAACDSESKSLHRGGSEDAGEAGEAPGGLGPGGESSGGAIGTGGSGGAGGRSAGGRGGSAGTGLGGSGAASGVGGVAGSLGGAGVPCGLYDCSRLPQVKPGAAVECRNGVCILPPDACEEGFAHCSASSNVGCEADLRSSNTCADCETSCSGSTPACTLGPNGWHCSDGCEEPTPDKCGFICTNLDTDAGNCGECRNDCRNHAPGQCVAGECMRTGPCEPGFGDCNDQNGCETDLTTPEHCGACGRNSCGAENAAAECSSPSGCVPPTCLVGFANCDRTSLDCEAPAETACFPTALPAQLLALPPARVTILDGGSLFAVGSFSETVDFDASAGVDTHVADIDGDAYATRFEASGAYAWTRTFGGAFEDYVGAAGLSREGTPLLAGIFVGSADLDPGPGVDQHVADTSGSAFVIKLTAAGDFVWARDLRGQVLVSEVAGDSAGAVYANGMFYGTVDLDPGPATSLHTAGEEGGTFLVKLDAAGNFAWDETIDGYGYREFTGLAVAADGSVWVAGRHSGQMSLGGTSLGDEAGMFVAGLEPSGTVRTLWSPAAPTNVSVQPLVAAGTNVHVKGKFAQSLDVDPGSATVTRVSTPVYGTSGFTLGLDLNGAYASAHVFPAEPFAIGATPGGGSLVVHPVESATPSSRSS